MWYYSFFSCNVSVKSITITIMNLVTLDKSIPEIAEAVAGCEVGKPQTFTITMTPVVDDDTKLLATIDSIEYAEGAGAVEEEEPAAPAGEKPYKPKASSGVTY